jgi:hypothetical protein
MTRVQENVFEDPDDEFEKPTYGKAASGKRLMWIVYAVGALMVVGFIGVKTMGKGGEGPRDANFPRMATDSRDVVAEPPAEYRGGGVAPMTVPASPAVTGTGALNGGGVGGAVQVQAREIDEETARAIAELRAVGEKRAEDVAALERRIAALQEAVAALSKPVVAAPVALQSGSAAKPVATGQRDKAEAAKGDHGADKPSATAGDRKTETAKPTGPVVRVAAPPVVKAPVVKPVALDAVAVEPVRPRCVLRGATDNAAYFSDSNTGPVREAMVGANDPCFGMVSKIELKGSQWCVSGGRGRLCS